MNVTSQNVLIITTSLIIKTIRIMEKKSPQKL